MAVRGWLASEPRPYAWLSLDDGDDDPARLVRYLCAALRDVRPGVGDGTLTLLGASGLRSIDFVVATLLDEVAAASAPFTLVLDDCHLLASDVGQELVGRFVAHAPPFVQVVMITRQDPRLPVSRLRAHGRLVEVRADELRYTPSEAATLMASLGVVLDPASIDVLVDRTEGWAAGLQLAALTLRGVPGSESGGHARIVAEFGASHRYVIDYLADEVLARLPERLRRFLERTSVADRLSPGLVEVLTGEKDGERTLREVEERNLFLVPLAPDRSWYRYHHLFADHLRSRLDEEARRDLLLTAAEWCAGQGLTAEAARYGLASGRWPAAVPLVAAGSRAALELGEPGAVLRWTDGVPSQTLESSAELLADRAWAGYLGGQMSAAVAAGKRLAELEAEGPLEPEAAGRALGIRAWLAIFERDPAEGERLARLALQSLDDDVFFRGLVLLALSDASWDLGKVDENAAAVREALRLARERPPTLATYLAGYMHAIGCNEQGRRPEGERTCRELIAESTDAAGRILPAAGPIRVGLGIVAYEANDLPTAATELEAGFAMCRKLGMEEILGGESRRARAMTRLAIGGPEAARQAAQEGLTSGRRYLPVTRIPAAEAIAATVAVRSGDARSAVRWAERVLADPERTRTSPPNVRLYRDIALARVLYATGAVARAEAVAIEAGRYAAWAGTLLGEIQATILAACCAEQGGRRSEARARLGRAIALAAPGGYVRRFVEDAPPVAHLLPTLRGGDEEFVDGVMDALQAEAVRATPGRSTPGAPWRAADGALLELLTQRELEVLRLLSRGRSNAEIGETLGVSAGTAKWHVANVLGKLGASSRTEAASRARDLDLV